MSHYDVIIIGAGAAGLMCGARAGARRRSVLILDHASKPAEKVRISGGGRCNFTNLYCGPNNFLSQNPHFCKSALRRYTQHDFIALVERYGIAYHEKTKGQLFCDGKSQQIIDMLIAECKAANNNIQLSTEVLGVDKKGERFLVSTPRQTLTADNVVVACGGPSIPKMGASRFGYQLADQFGLNVVEPVPALVPLTFTDGLKEPIKALSGVSVDSRVSHSDATFDEALLFTHRGLSGPAILQISSYWSPGDEITLDLAPGQDLLTELKRARVETPRKSPAVWLTQYLPQRLADYMASYVRQVRLADMPDTALTNLALMVNQWYVKPAGSEGFRTAEVTKGGVNTDDLSSKTMEAKAVPGLYFIGEVVDVTGHLGGHNFQWAWASGVACGDAI
ncbi:NAD(P)/FAD-dependent oxidoreductase [Litorimonas sp. RW-G-Af-16]|uniref:NAD(P)/FAD-dependent oxidoreductase n=1 Tax=Litorimonas sp. RW-G-Af-16 TaxID=3241168 RepID=UPI00390CC014